MIMAYFAASFVSIRCPKVTRGIRCITSPHPALGADAVPKGVIRHYRQVGTTVDTIV